MIKTKISEKYFIENAIIYESTLGERLILLKLEPREGYVLMRGDFRIDGYAVISGAQISTLMEYSAKEAEQDAD